MLNITLFLVLSVVGGVFSEFDCSYQAENSCGEIKNDWEGKTWPQNEKELDKACSDIRPTLDCQINFADNCPKSLLRVFLESLVETKSIYRKLCSYRNTFKEEYLRNVRCLNKHVSELFVTCKQTSRSKKSGICGNYVDIRNCVFQEISNRCGTGGRKVFDMLYKPMLIVDKIFCKKYQETHELF